MSAVQNTATDDSISIISNENENIQYNQIKITNVQHAATSLNNATQMQQTCNQTIKRIFTHDLSLIIS